MNRSFRAFLATQLLGAFNDNLFKQLILFLAASVLFPGEDLQGLAFAVFALPFVLFSGVAGDLSERYSKSQVMLLMKWAEIGIMVLGALALQLKNWHFLLAVLFVMGMQSAFFGPAKYGSIPELVDDHQLIRANGAVTMTTFVAVLLAGALAGPLLDTLGASLWACGAVCVALAALGTYTASIIKPLEATRPELRVLPDNVWNPAQWLVTLYGGLFRTIAKLSQQEGLLRIVLLNSAYWFNAGVFNQAVVGMGAPELLNIGEGEKTKLSLVLATLSISVALGALSAPKLAKRWHPGRTAAFFTILMAIGQSSMNLIATVFPSATTGLLSLHLCSAWTGFTGAIVVVPLASYLQYAPPKGMRGATFGVTNFFNFVFILLAGVFYLVLRGQLGYSPALVQTLSAAFMIAVLWFTRSQVRRLEIA